MKKYAKELEDNMNEKNREIQTITTKFDTPYVSMAEAIAERFGETRTSILQNVIEQGVAQLFLSFDESHREELAKIADGKTTEYMLSKGAKIQSYGVLGSFENEWTDWRMKIYEHGVNQEMLKITEENPDIEFNEAVRLAHLQYEKGDSK